jgi:alpha-glucosidase
MQFFTWVLIPHNFHSAAGNTDEELCNRWMQLAAFTPFFRNHNIRGAIPQEPYRWDSVASATRVATAVRYALLPYWARLFFFAISLL